MPVEISHRPISAAERAVLAERAAKVRAYRAQALRARVMEPLVPGLGGVALGGLLWAFGWGAGPFVLAVGLALAAMGGLGYLRGRAGLAAPTPHDLGEGPVNVEQRRILAQRVAFAIDEQGDGATWCLFEVEAGGWYVIADEELPLLDRRALRSTLARAELVWTIAPSGASLSAVGLGPPIPALGALAHLGPGDGPEGIDQDIAGGFCWSPQDSGEGRVLRGADLPAWLAEAAAPPLRSSE